MCKSLLGSPLCCDSPTLPCPAPLLKSPFPGPAPGPWLPGPENFSLAFAPREPPPLRGEEVSPNISHRAQTCKPSKTSRASPREASGSSGHPAVSLCTLLNGHPPTPTLQPLVEHSTVSLQSSIDKQATSAAQTDPRFLCVCVVGPLSSVSVCLSPCASRSQSCMSV